MARKKVIEPKDVCEGILMWRGHCSLDEIKKEWERIGLGYFQPEAMLQNCCLFKGSKEAIDLCVLKIRNGETEIFTSVGQNRRVRAC